MDFLILCALCSIAFFCGMKIGEDNEKVKHMNDKLKLSKKWQRFSVKAPVAKGRSGKRFMIILVNKDKPDDVTVWIDAVQFERGKEPTEFQP